MIDFDSVLPRLSVGTCPISAADTRALQQCGVTAVLNLQTDRDLVDWGINWPAISALYQAVGIEVRRVPIRDFDPADLQANLVQAVAALEELLSAGHTVYVHCNAGINRSPTTVVAYLHWVEKLSLDEAVEHVMHCRSCDPYIDTVSEATRLRRPDQE